MHFHFDLIGYCALATGLAALALVWTQRRVFRKRE